MLMGIKEPYKAATLVNIVAVIAEKTSGSLTMVETRILQYDWSTHCPHSHSTAADWSTHCLHTPYTSQSAYTFWSYLPLSGISSLPASIDTSNLSSDANVHIMDCNNKISTTLLDNWHSPDLNEWHYRTGVICELVLYEDWRLKRTGDMWGLGWIMTATIKHK